MLFVVHAQALEALPHSVTRRGGFPAFFHRLYFFKMLIFHSSYVIEICNMGFVLRNPLPVPFCFVVEKI